MRRRLGLTLALAALLLVLARPASAALPIDRPTDAEWAQTLAAAGHWVDFQVALQVMFAESGGNPMAQNPSGARGAWQFMPNTLADDNCAYDPVCSTKAAYDTSKGGTDWHRWVAFTSDAYTSTSARAAAAIQAAGLNAQPQPGPTLPTLPRPEVPASSAGMGIDGLIPPPPIGNGNQPLLFERYAPDSYGVMHLDLANLAQSAIGAILGFNDPSQVAMNVSLNTAASLGADILVLVGIVTTRLLAWSLRVDLLAGADGPLNAFVGGLAQGLYQPLVPLLLIVFAGWLVWTWMLRRRTTRGVVGVGWMFLAMTLGSIYFAAPAAVLDQASAFTSAISRSVLGAVGGADTQIAHRGDPTIAKGPADDAELRLFSDRFWSVYVYQPWTDAQFGRVDPKGVSGQPLGVELLDKRASRSNHFDEDLAQQPQEVRDWYDGADGVQRLVIIGVALLVALVACIIFLAAAVVRLASAVVFLALLMALPLFLLMALHPAIGRKLLLRWLELALGALWRQVVYTLFLAVMVVLVGVVSAAAAGGGWGLVALCQLAAAAGILIFRKPLLAIFGQLGAHRLKLEHVGASRVGQTAHLGLGEARQRTPIPAFAQRASKAKGAKAGGGEAAGGEVATKAAKTAETAKAATASQAASGAAAGAATGGWALAAAVALKAGQVAVRKGEVAKRQLQDAAASPFLVNGKAGKPPPRRMSERPLGVDRRTVTSHAWSKVRHRPQFAEGESATAVVEAAPEQEALPEPKEKTPKALRTARWVREPGGAHVFTPQKSQGGKK